MAYDKEIILDSRSVELFKLLKRVRDILADAPKGVFVGNGFKRKYLVQWADDGRIKIKYGDWQKHRTEQDFRFWIAHDINEYARATISYNFHPSTHKFFERFYHQNWSRNSQMDVVRAIGGCSAGGYFIYSTVQALFFVHDLFKYDWNSFRKHWRRSHRDFYNKILFQSIAVES